MLINYELKRTPQFFALAQTCRQIRAEYSPIYAAQTELHVCHIDIAEFMASNFPHMACDGDGKVIGSLVVDCRGLDDGISKGTHKTDLLPLLKHCAATPGLTVRAGLNHCDTTGVHEWWSAITGSLNTLFEVAQKPQLADWLEEAVDAVNLSYCDSRFEIVVKKGHVEKWMGAIGNDSGSFDEDSPEVPSWVAGSGISADMVWRLESSKSCESSKDALR
jgi:hypothetical protein